MNENKTKLILMIATRLSDEQCAAILSRIEESPEMIANKLINACGLANNKAWDESEHPRADDGKFAPGGSGRSEMRKSEAAKWDKTGHSTPGSKRITQLKGEIRKLEKRRDKFAPSEIRQRYERDIVTAKRELAEAQRDEKQRRRLDLEHSVSSRVLKKKVAEFHDLEDEIDYMEEKFADRNVDSPTHGEMSFPKTKAGEKARQRFDELVKRRDELDADIDWDEVE